MANANNKEHWSWSTGERGVNRVRCYEDRERGVIFLEWYDRAVSGASRRERISAGHADRERAKQQAEVLAAKLRASEPVRDTELTLHAVLQSYLREVTPIKGEQKQAHDRRTAEMFMQFLGATFPVKRLSRLEWDRFIKARASGRLAHRNEQPRRAKDPTVTRFKTRAKLAPRGVGEAQIAQDLNFLRAVCNWATTVKDRRGVPLLEHSPVKGLKVPKNSSPVRSIITPEQYEALLDAAATHENPDVWLALVLAHETGHRIGAIRQLRWSDIDLANGTITWRKESDKIGMEHTVVITQAAKAALHAARARRPAIGTTWVLPAPGDDRQLRPVSVDRVRAWWERIAAVAELPAGRRLGWHSLRRKFATELKHVPLPDVCQLGGWKDPRTILLCYQQPDAETQRQALAMRGLDRRAVPAPQGRQGRDGSVRRQSGA